MGGWLRTGCFICGGYGEGYRIMSELSEDEKALCASALLQGSKDIEQCLDGLPEWKRGKLVRAAGMMILIKDRLLAAVLEDA